MKRIAFSLVAATAMMAGVSPALAQDGYTLPPPPPIDPQTYEQAPYQQAPAAMPVQTYGDAGMPAPQVQYQQTGPVRHYGYGEAQYAPPPAQYPAVHGTAAGSLGWLHARPARSLAGRLPAAVLRPEEEERRNYRRPARHGRRRHRRPRADRRIENAADRRNADRRRRRRPGRRRDRFGHRRGGRPRGHGRVRGLSEPLHRRLRPWPDARRAGLWSRLWLRLRLRRIRHDHGAGADAADLHLHCPDASRDPVRDRGSRRGEDRGPANQVRAHDPANQVRQGQAGREVHKAITASYRQAASRRRWRSWWPGAARSRFRPA